LHQRLRGQGLRARAIELLNWLRIPAAEERLKNYPHQFSGGMRQRVVGAIGVSCSPEVLIADEPTTALDVTVQAAYLALLKDIQRQTELAILFITHDFGVVARMCDRVAVMYAGKVVETAPTWDLFDHPAHPYAEALINSVPDVRVGVQRLYAIAGYPPSIYERPTGCPFAPRCPDVLPRCRAEFPPEVEVGPGHRTSCWRHV
jgi:oligopeptide/dipeptide ABC transporter ATP-binding protein